jgi:hypothetical protein
LFIEFEKNVPGSRLSADISNGGTFLVPTDNFLNDPNVKPYLTTELDRLKKKENALELEKVGYGAH